MCRGKLPLQILRNPNALPKAFKQTLKFNRRALPKNYLVVGKGSFFPQGQTSVDQLGLVKPTDVHDVLF